MRLIVFFVHHDFCSILWRISSLFAYTNWNWTSFKFSLWFQTKTGHIFMMILLCQVCNFKLKPGVFFMIFLCHLCNFKLKSDFFYDDLFVLFLWWPFSAIFMMIFLCHFYDNLFLSGWADQTWSSSARHWETYK